MKRLAVAAAVSVIALWAFAPAQAQTGPFNLGPVDVSVEPDDQWLFDARVFETEGAQHELDNATWSLGAVDPSDDSSEWKLVFSRFTSDGPNPLNAAVRTSRRTVLAISRKHRMTSRQDNPMMSLDLGVDVSVQDTVGINTVTSGSAEQDFLTPAAKLQIGWGSPGGKQLQLAAQAAWWEDNLPTNMGMTIPGYGTVFSVGGGLTWPMSNDITLAGDVMFPVGGENAINASNMVDEESVWSVGGVVDLGGSKNAKLYVYATNSMAPTLGGSIIAASTDSTALGVGLRQDL